LNDAAQDSELPGRISKALDASERRRRMGVSARNGGGRIERCDPTVLPAGSNGLTLAARRFGQAKRPGPARPGRRIVHAFGHDHHRPALGPVAETVACTAPTPGAVH
jgi:hypothetical protein